MRLGIAALFMVPEMGFMIKTIFFLFIESYFLMTIGRKKKYSSSGKRSTHFRCKDKYFNVIKAVTP